MPQHFPLEMLVTPCWFALFTDVSKELDASISGVVQDFLDYVKELNPTIYNMNSNLI